MSVTEVTLHSSGATSSEEDAGNGASTASYEAMYRVKCSDPLDGPYIVKQHFRRTSSLPWMGRIYQYGNDRDPTCVCKTVNPSYIAGSEGWWEVTCSFESIIVPDPASGPGGSTVDGKEAKNPFELHHEIEVSSTQFYAPVERAVFIGATAGTSKWLKIGAEGPVVNSAGVPFNPGLEDEKTIKIIRITKVVPTYVAALFDHLQGRVNNDEITIDKAAYGFSQRIRRFCGKIHAISATFNVQGEFKFYRRTVEIHIHPDPKGWHREVLDRGLARSRAKGDAKGDGDTEAMETADEAAVFAEAGVFHEAARDHGGYPIGSPLMFDGTGKPKSPTLPPVWLEYQTKPETSFAGLNFLWED